MRKEGLENLTLRGQSMRSRGMSYNLLEKFVQINGRTRKYYQEQQNTENCRVIITNVLKEQEIGRS